MLADYNNVFGNKHHPFNPCRHLLFNKTDRLKCTTFDINTPVLLYIFMINALKNTNTADKRDLVLLGHALGNDGLPSIILI